MLVERFLGWVETAPADRRANAVRALARAYLQSQFEGADQDAAEAALTCILDDCDPGVRQAMAEALAPDPASPRHVILALAGDTPEVSLPVLRLSPVLLDAELVEAVASGNAGQQEAIACREPLSATLAQAIAEQGSREACLALMLNPSAKPLPQAFLAIATRFGDDAELRTCMLARHDTGMQARLLLIEKYALSLVGREEAQNGFSRERQEAELRDICEKATITYAAQVTDEEIREIVVALVAAGKLTAAYLLRSICMGNISLFAHALSHLSGQRIERVEEILKEGRRNAFSAVYLKAGLPKSAFDVFELTIDCWRRLLTSDANPDPASLPYRVTSQVLCAYEGARNGETDRLLVLLRKICTEAARESARARIEQIALAREEAALLLESHEADDEGALSEEEMYEFAARFANELADMALEAEEALDSASENLIAANMPFDEDPEFVRALDLPGRRAA